MNSFSIGGNLAQLQARVSKSDKGLTHPNLSNAMLILALDPCCTDLVGYNEFETEAQLLRPPPVANPGDRPAPGPYPRPWQPADVALVTAYIQRTHCERMRAGDVEQAMVGEADRRRFHPVRDWLDSLRWDGVSRLDHWLHEAFGADDSAYVQAVAAKTLIAAVRRIRQPGCKFDTMPVLEGGQGMGKSRSIKRLFGEFWFTDAMPPDLKSKDGSQAMLGIWCIEFAEMEHLIRQEVETIKAFLSRAVERYRPSYGRSFVKRPRQCIFIGTTNSTDYLRDATGNRRIWPITCRHADEIWIAQNRDQLWAEAAHREKQGEAIWIDGDEARTEAAAQQDERMSEDVWTDGVRAWLSANPGALVTVPKVLTEAISMPTDRHDKRSEMRMSAILTRLGYQRTQTRRGGSKPIRHWIIRESET
ncbi:virulence-associated E family protein [Belnapia moabensis]|uniref:virulence-associated E family protein n=1 Tax=Belnapia moabensis TaxID=365533 RepID=UPI000A427028|nr:virulence-associated E family protein [Belnapia moabensis]